jgi:SNF2 family DNA or RNA helicase
MQYKTYKDFDEAYGFAKKAGFQLTEMQVELVENLASWRKSLNKSEVGCGKTVMATVASLMLGHEVSVITVPPILITGWAKWLNKVSSGVVVYRGDPRERGKLVPLLKTARWIICSHAIYRTDFETLKEAVKDRDYELIVDEAHALKNPQSVLFKKTQLLTAGDIGCQLLTGTPVSKPLDAYSYVKLKHPKVYRSYGHFEAMHVAERDFFKKPTEFCNLDLLASNLNMQTVSANKEEMHGYSLKPLVPDCSYDLDPEHYRLYAKLVDEQLLSFDDGSVIDATTSQKLRQALQQVVVNWDYFSNDPSKKSAAYDVIDQTLEEIEVSRLDKSKLIIWVQYKRSARSVLDYCNKLGIKTVAAYSEADTEKSVQAFLEDDKTRILVGNPQSCGAGLNPQHVCSEALFLEMSTVPLYMHQSMGRIDRMGQTRVPRFKFAVANKTVQTGLLASLLNGDDLMQKVAPTKTSIRAMLLGEI